ncbi:MAG TPA: adenylyl-sulfate kinase [Nitrospiraceae bacterium]|nr:adenylyl-sulfate kinase [Nitrospiraceae bacterium]
MQNIATVQDAGTDQVRHVDSQGDLLAKHGGKGFTVWFTGLPASGKSTLSKAAHQALLMRGIKTPELLDADEIRTNISKGLGFSKEDRITNILRIGWIAQLLTKHQIPNLVACIAPYEQARKQVREMVEVVGGKGSFIEVFVDCPLEACVRRDPKGLYAKAFAGEIEKLSGLNDTYEAPEHPELRLNTATHNIAEAVECLVEYLETNHLIEASK